MKFNFKIELITVVYFTILLKANFISEFMIINKLLIFLLIQTLMT